MRIPFTNLNLNLKKANNNKIEVDKSVFEEFISTDARFNGKRPKLNPQESLGDDQVLIPYTPLPMDIIYDAARYSDVLRTIHQNIRKEIFRKGYEIKEVFASKCEDCLKEFDQPVDECDECGSTNIKEPDVNQKKLLVEFCKEVNDNGQDLIQVSEGINDDLETIDNAYMLMIKDYYWDKDGNKVGEVPVELIRCDPRFMYIMADKMGRPAKNQSGDDLKVCFEHRDILLTNKEDKCPKCGKQVFPANYRTQNPDDSYMYYNKNEVTLKAKYNPSLTYGFSVIYSIWMKVVTLMNMDLYMKTYYTKQRPPRGLLFVNTPNMDSLTKAWNWMLDEFKKNPHQIPPIAIEQTAGSKGNLVNFVDMMKGLDEMQYIECRNEMRRQIGAVYGVMPIFQGDISTSGGLNNEGLQITVTNRAIIDGQGVYNDGFYPWICKQLEVTDYKIWLPPNEEEDLVHNEELFAKKIDNAKKMQEMGFDVLLNEEGDFEFDPLDEPVEAPDPMGGMGGLPGQQPEDPTAEDPNQDEPRADGEPDTASAAQNNDLGGEPPVASMTKAIKKGKVSVRKPLKKGKVYLAPGQQAPEGTNVQQGPKGGKYYEEEAGGQAQQQTPSGNTSSESNEKHSAAIHEYGQGMFNSKVGGYVVINSFLRTGNIPKYAQDSTSNEKVQSIANDLSSAIQDSKLEQDMTLFRGMLNTYKDAKVGDILEDKAFISTTSDKKTAGKFNEILNRGDVSVILEIKAKQGDPVLKNPDPQEKEFLFDKDTKFYVDKVTNRGGVKHIFITAQE